MYIEYESTDRGPMECVHPDPGCDFCAICGEEYPHGQLALYCMAGEPERRCDGCWPRCHCGERVVQIGEGDCCAQHEMEACLDVLRDGVESPTHYAAALETVAALGRHALAAARRK